MECRAFQGISTARPSPPPLLCSAARSASPLAFYCVRSCTCSSFLPLSCNSRHVVLARDFFSSGGRLPAHLRCPSHSAVHPNAEVSFPPTLPFFCRVGTGGRGWRPARINSYTLFFHSARSGNSYRLHVGFGFGGLQQWVHGFQVLAPDHLICYIVSVYLWTLQLLLCSLGQHWC